MKRVRTEDMEWRDEFNVNVLEIDELRCELFNLLVSLMSEIKDGQKSEQAHKRLEDIFDGFTHAFETEQRYFNKFDYVEKMDHLEEHEYLLQRLDEFKKSYDDSYPLLNMGYFEDFCSAYLEHLQVRDREFRDFIRENCRSTFLTASG